MSLQTDILFVAAIKSDASIMDMLPASDVYNTFIPVPDEDLDNVPLPYVIVAECDVDNNETTKDDYEGDTDNVLVEITVVARTRAELGMLTSKIRKAVYRYFSSPTESDEIHGLIQYHVGAKQVNGEPYKPSVWRILTYQCEVINDTITDDDE